MNINALAYNVYKTMAEKNVSLTELANRIKCDRSGLYKRLRDPKMVKVAELIRIGNALGIDWRKLMEGVDE